VFVGLGLALAPVNAAALASAPQDAHSVVSLLVVLARMVEMVVGATQTGQVSWRQAASQNIHS
jgi:hypothetical protein